MFGELEHLKIKTRLIDEKFASVMGECDLEVMGVPSILSIIRKTLTFLIHNKQLLTHKVKTKQHVTKRRCRHCRDIEMSVYLPNSVDPVSLVLDLRITHDRFGSRSDPSLNGHLHYPNDIDKSLNEVAVDKI